MTTVAEYQQIASDAAAATLAQANTYLTALTDAANVRFSNGFNIDQQLPAGYGYASVPTVEFPVVSGGLRPAVTNISVDGLPAAPDFSFSAIVDPAVPELTAVAPPLEFPTVPSATLPATPGSTPEFNSPALPASPDVTLPSVPTFESLSLPEPPSMEVPAFISGLPTVDFLTPTTTFEFFESEYSSTLLDPLKVKLLADLQNGGYGIDTTDEDALFNRARDREVQAALTRIEEAGRTMAARGFPLPPGELSIHIDRAYQEMQDKVSGISREIFVDSAKRFVENRQFTIKEVRETEQILIGFHNSVQERALNAARATVELAVAIYNTNRDKFLARLEAYKAEGTVFTERVRAGLTQAEIYRTQLEGKRVQTEINRQLIDVYVAKLKGIQTSADIYKTQVDAANVLANIERAKLEAFRAQIDAYTAQVQAKVAEFGMYRSQIEGQKARVDIYDAEVRAFNGQVTAQKTKSDIQLGRLQAEEAQAKVQLSNYQAQIAAYEADLRRQVEPLKLQVDLFQADIAANRNLTDGLVAKAQLQQKVMEATVQQNIQISGLNIELAKAKLLATVEGLKFRTEAANFGAKEFFAALTAMYSSINSLAVQSSTE